MRSQTPAACWVHSSSSLVCEWLQVWWKKTFLEDKRSLQHSEHQESTPLCPFLTGLRRLQVPTHVVPLKAKLSALHGTTWARTATQQAVCCFSILLVLKANTKWESVFKTLGSHLALSKIPATFLLLCSLLLQVPSLSQQLTSILTLAHVHTHTHSHAHLHTHSLAWVSSHPSIFLMVDNDGKHLLKSNSVPSTI